MPDPSRTPSAAISISSGPPPLQIPDLFTSALLNAALRSRLAGRPATPGSTLPGAADLTQVVWVDAGSEVLVHLDSIQTSISAGMLLISVDFECDQIGRAALVAVFAMNSGTDAAGLFAATDELPRGNGLLAARWGKIFQNAIWAALTGLVSDHAAERKLAPLGLVATANGLTLHSGPALDVRQFAQVKP